MNKTKNKSKKINNKVEKTIVLTGGGSAGHVTPNLAILPRLKEEGFTVKYIGGNGIEKELVEKAGIPFHTISAGKLRRYFDVKNFTDTYKVIKGMGEAYSALKTIKPSLVFSKGGFVSVPVVIAARLLNIPVIIHEADLTPGLANKISSPFANKICVSFPETLEKIPKAKAQLTGLPIRQFILNGDRQKGLRYCGFDGKKPVLLVFGGSLGSAKINDCIRSSLVKLTKCYCVAHICGKGKTVDTGSFDAHMAASYKQFEYVDKELADLFAMADVVISRAGANSIFELLALKKPHILIPLPKTSTSRGDQILNANSFKQQGFSKILYEDSISPESIFVEVADLISNKESYIEKMKSGLGNNSIEEIVKLIKEMA